MRIKGCIGEINDSGLMAVVIIDDPDDFMPSRRARTFAARLLRAADAADAKMLAREKATTGPG